MRGKLLSFGEPAKLTLPDCLPMSECAPVLVWTMSKLLEFFAELCFEMRTFSDQPSFPIPRTSSIHPKPVRSSKSPAQSYEAIRYQQEAPGTILQSMRDR